jgi:hypothetical protein
MAATAQQPTTLQRDSDEDEGSDEAVDEVTLFVCFICAC